jgi:hypothetical protein
MNIITPVDELGCAAEADTLARIVIPSQIERLEENLARLEMVWRGIGDVHGRTPSDYPADALARLEDVAAFVKSANETVQRWFDQDARRPHRP